MNLGTLHIQFAGSIRGAGEKLMMIDGAVGLIDRLQRFERHLHRPTGRGVYHLHLEGGNVHIGLGMKLEGVGKSRLALVGPPLSTWNLLISKKVRWSSSK